MEKRKLVIGKNFKGIENATVLREQKHARKKYQKIFETDCETCEKRRPLDHKGNTRNDRKSRFVDGSSNGFYRSPKGTKGKYYRPL